MCKNYSEKGFCPYGEKCKFAHGLDELLITDQKTKKKPAKCRNFWKKGFCTYGLRCKFRHSDLHSFKIIEEPK